MCYKTCPISSCGHCGPTKWSFCNRRGSLERNLGDACIDSVRSERQLDQQAVHDGRNVAFCCSESCCNDEVSRLLQEEGALRRYYENRRRFARGEAIQREYDDLTDAIRQVVLSVQLHKRCSADRNQYFNQLRGEQPYLFRR